MKCLVTGGAGFIGSHLVDELIKLGHDVTCIDNESAISNAKFYYNDNASNYKLDILDYDSIEKLFKNIDCVFHLASDARIQLSVANPSNSIDTNIIGTLNVLKSSIKHGVKKFVYSSSSSIYGDSNLYVNTEIDDPSPQTIYAESKLICEKFVKIYTDVHDIDGVSLRYFNAYGHRQPTSGAYATVIGKFLNQKTNGLPLTIVGDGKQQRDFTHISDIINATISVGISEHKTNGEVYNVGTGTSYRIVDIAKIISDNISFIPERVGESKYVRANNDKIFKDFKWNPQINLMSWLLTNR